MTHRPRRQELAPASSGQGVEQLVHGIIHRPGGRKHMTKMAIRKVGTIRLTANPCYYCC
jgi:hypothetical protein